MDYSTTNTPLASAYGCSADNGQQKLPYTSPVLQVFGSVGMLTQGKKGSGSDWTNKRSSGNKN